MASPVGRKKAGGREKGTPNLDTTALCEQLREMGYNPVAELVEVAAIAKQDYVAGQKDAHKLLEVRAKSAAEIIQYMFPKRKAVEFTGADGANIFDTFAAAMKAASDKFEKEKAIEVKAEPIPNANS